MEIPPHPPRMLRRRVFFRELLLRRIVLPNRDAKKDFKICIILYNNNIFYPTFGKGWSKSAEGFMEGFAPLRTKLTEAQAPVKKEFKGWTTPN